MKANDIAKLSIEFYENLKKTGKPSDNEWTVLATILLEIDNKLEVIALGTGTKCIGKSKMSAGSILNDSHAEIVCRRAFIRFLYNEMFKEHSNLIILQNNKFNIANGIKFHMFSSLMPCGDASIFAKNDVFDECGEILLMETNSDDSQAPEAKRAKLDYHRTGAKCLPNDKVDGKTFGGGYHVLGSVRTKPGRGDPTVSVSCSDKLCKWIHLGVQGNLLSLLLETPIYLSSITIGNTHYCKDALERALYKRFNSFSHTKLGNEFARHVPELFQSNFKEFTAQKCNGKQPAPGSIIYIKNGKLEVAVEGLKQGVTKKNRDKLSAQLQICKLELFKCFVNVSKKLNLNIDLSLSYSALKNTSEYSKSWSELKTNMFKVWPKKNASLEEFYCM